VWGENIVWGENLVWGESVSEHDKHDGKKGGRK